MWVKGNKNTSLSKVSQKDSKNQFKGLDKRELFHHLL